MFERFTERARQVVVLAQEEARTLKHNYIGTEHFLLGLLREEEGLACRALESYGITTERVRVHVVRIIGMGDEVTSGQLPFTPRVKKIMELALREALSLGHNYIGTEHLLLALLREREGVGVRILLELSEDPKIDETLCNEVIRMLSGPGGRKHVDDSSAVEQAAEHKRLEDEVDKITREKEEAVDDQHFEEASRLGHQENALRQRLVELVEKMRNTIAYWTVAVTYRAPDGKEIMTDCFGDWPEKPSMYVEGNGNVYRFEARGSRIEEHTVIIPTNGAIAIEIVQVQNAASQEAH